MFRAIRIVWRSPLKLVFSSNDDDDDDDGDDDFVIWHQKRTDLQFKKNRKHVRVCHVIHVMHFLHLT
jgi:hypothetical protein